MATTLGENAHATTGVQSGKNSLVNSCLIHVRRHLEFGSLKLGVLIGWVSGEVSILINVLPASQLG